MESWFNKKETLEDLIARKNQIKEKIKKELQSHEQEFQNAKKKLIAAVKKQQALAQYDIEAREIILKSAKLIRKLHEINRQIVVRTAINYTRKDLNDILKQQGINFDPSSYHPEPYLNPEAVKKVINNPKRIYNGLFVPYREFLT